MAMINGYPTEDELRQRIERQVSWRGATDNVSLIWRGYLAALIEWGLVDPAVHGRLVKLLPAVGVKELDEVFSGERITPEREREIDEYLAMIKKDDKS